MTAHDERGVGGLFARTSRVVTPDPAGHLVRVLFAPVSLDSEVSRHCASVLSENERRRAHRFAAEDDRVLFQQRRAFRRFCGALALGSGLPLSEIHFAETENGRPYLPTASDLWFSFSSCRLGMLGAWSSTHGVGVDIEDPTREVETVALARRFFSAAEAEAITSLDGAKRRHMFYQLWTLKEAALKSIGKGLPYGLDAFAFELDPDPRFSLAPREFGAAAAFEAYSIEGTNTCAALVVRRPARGLERPRSTDRNSPTEQQ